jgi:hypothetical protein
MVPGTFPNLARGWCLLTIRRDLKWWFKDDHKFCLKNVASLLLNGGLGKTTNQIVPIECGSNSGSLVHAQLIGLQNLKLDCQSLISFPVVKEKVRRWKYLHYKMCQCSRINSLIWSIYLLGCWWPLQEVIHP